MDEKPKKKNKPVSDFDALHSIAVATGAGFTLLSSIGVGVWLGLKCVLCFIWIFSLFFFT